jgi:hypothetical protein
MTLLNTGKLKDTVQLDIDAIVFRQNEVNNKNCYK